MNFSTDFLNKCKTVIDQIDTEEIEKIVNVLFETRNNKGRLFIIGSGGGAGHASHAVCDFRKLCNIESYAPYDNISELTARTNDEGWETSILNWLLVSKIKKEDCLFVLSVGGGNIENKISMNIVNSLRYANEIGTKIVGVVGKDGGYTKKVGTVIVIPTIDEDYITPITEGFQAIIWHLLVSHPKLKINQTIW